MGVFGSSLAGRWSQRLEFEDKNVKVGGNLVANTDTVTHQVKERQDLQERTHKSKHSHSAFKYYTRESISFNYLSFCPIYASCLLRF